MNQDAFPGMGRGNGGRMDGEEWTGIDRVLPLTATSVGRLTKVQRTHTPHDMPALCALSFVLDIPPLRCLAR